jgi:cyanate permease
MPRRAPTLIKSLVWKPGILDILRQRSAWGTCLGQFCINYPLYFLVTWLPFYLIRGRGLTLTHMARVGALVFLLFAIATTVCGKLSDLCIARGSTPTRVRKPVLILGGAATAIFLVAAALAPKALCVPMLAMVGVSLGTSSSNHWAVTQTLAGSGIMGRWAGVQNFVGNLAGAVAPALTGFLLDRTGQFYWAFFITAAISGIGCLGWIFVVGRVEAVDWQKHLRRSSGISAYSAPEAPQP